MKCLIQCIELVHLLQTLFELFEHFLMKSEITAIKVLSKNEI